TISLLPPSAVPAAWVGSAVTLEGAEIGLFLANPEPIGMMPLAVLSGEFVLLESRLPESVSERSMGSPDQAREDRFSEAAHGVMGRCGMSNDIVRGRRPEALPASSNSRARPPDLVPGQCPGFAWSACLWESSALLQTVTLRQKSTVVRLRASSEFPSNRQ